MSSFNRIIYNPIEHSSSIKIKYIKSDDFVYKTLKFILNLNIKKSNIQDSKLIKIKWFNGNNKNKKFNVEHISCNLNKLKIEVEKLYDKNEEQILTLFYSIWILRNDNTYVIDNNDGNYYQFKVSTKHKKIMKEIM